MADTKNTSRRDFLKASSVAAAGTALAGSLGIAESAHAAGSDLIRFVLIGSGGRGTGAANDNLGSTTNTKLVAVADAFEDRARSAAGRLKDSHADRVDVPDDRIFWGFDGYKQALACDCDMVVTAAPPTAAPQASSSAAPAALASLGLAMAFLCLL